MIFARLNVNARDIKSPQVFSKVLHFLLLGALNYSPQTYLKRWIRDAVLGDDAGDVLVRRHIECDPRHFDFITHTARLWRSSVQSGAVRGQCVRIVRLNVPKLTRN